ncbi:MAG: 6-phosphogluconolactonase [Candidatus Parabeggiatoa sp. nov. 1]|nr:MAG: 6-phosphogluconolactonase [Gammaproteobacteria bacterium]
MTNENTNPIYWQLLDDADAIAHEACQRILTLSKQSIEKQGIFRIVLTGGNTPKQTYRLLKEADCDWAHWHIYYGDERCLPEDDVERNSLMASRTWLDHVPIPATQIHPIPAHLGAVAAARQYTDVVKKALPFDMVLLGIGEDGHIASLFPGHTHPEDELVHAVFNAPKAPPERVSLSVATLCNTHKLWFLVTGTGKRDAVAAWRGGENLPVAQIQPATGATVLIDRAAYGK